MYAFDLDPYDPHQNSKDPTIKKKKKKSKQLNLEFYKLAK